MSVADGGHDGSSVSARIETGLIRADRDICRLNGKLGNVV